MTQQRTHSHAGWGDLQVFAEVATCRHTTAASCDGGPRGVRGVEPRQTRWMRSILLTCNAMHRSLECVLGVGLGPITVADWSAGQRRDWPSRTDADENAPAAISS